MEAVCSVVAVVLLFYTGFWLLSQEEHLKWGKFLKKETYQVTKKHQLSGIFFLSFMAVYRESVETIIFYNALYLQNPNTVILSLGFLCGAAVLFLLCFLIRYLQVNIPLKYFFRSTSILMLGISVFISGKAINELGSAGFLKITPLHGLDPVNWLGFYPSKEALLTQGFIALFALILYLVHMRKKPPLVS